MNKVIFSCDVITSSSDEIKISGVVIEPDEASIILGNANLDPVTAAIISKYDAIKLAKTILEYYG